MELVKAIRIVDAASEWKVGVTSNRSAIWDITRQDAFVTLKQLARTFVAEVAEGQAHISVAHVLTITADVQIEIAAGYQSALCSRALKFSGETTRKVRRVSLPSFDARGDARVSGE
jgi:hypothetical protein